MKTQTRATQIQLIRLGGNNLPPAVTDESSRIISVVEHPILVPVAGYDQSSEHQDGSHDQAKDERAHVLSVAGGRCCDH